MNLPLYMDEMVHDGITRELRLRGIDVKRAQDDLGQGAPDSVVLDRAAILTRILFTQDDDLLKETALRQRNGTPFGGVIYAHQLKVSIGQCVEDLELICQACDLEELANQVKYLPLR